MNVTKWLLVASACHLAFGAGRAHAQSEGFAVELFEPATGRAILGVGTSNPLKQAQFAVSLFTHYEDDPMTLVALDDRSEVLRRLIDSRITSELLAAVGIVEFIELGIGLPLVLAQSGEDLAPFGRPGEEVSGFSLGDLRVVPKFTILGGEEGFGLHVSVPLLLPTGDEDAFTGDDAVRIRPTLGLGWANSDGLRIAFEAGFEIRSERKAATYISDDMIRWALAGNVPIVRHMLAAQIALQGTVQTASGIDPSNPSGSLSDDPTVSFEVLGGLGLELENGLTLGAGAGFSIMRAVGSPDVRAYFAIGWVSPALEEGPATDDDGDGLIEGDRCPDEPEDKDDFADGDGCPDKDDDRDGIPDTADKCRLEPEDKDGVDDKDGCPDPDNDGDADRDGVANDQCPNEPEDKDGMRDDDGCPDPDNDGDGVLDVADKCTEAGEDKDGFQDEDGCPDPDNDLDGVADGADKCPTRPEVKNGIDDDDGCPDSADKDIAITEVEIKFPGKVNFPRDSDKITVDSLPLLDRIAKLLNEHTYLTKVRVEGHTDSEGVDTVNLELSQRRAIAVATYLVTKGVLGDRLVPVGYGESRPLMKNDTPARRATNRRVELKILQIDGKDLPEPPPPPKP